MSKNHWAAESDSLELKNRELATQQVRRINDTLLKVRKISRDSQNSLPQCPVVVPDAPAAPAAPLHVQEIPPPFSRQDARRERDDSTDKFLIPEPKKSSVISDVFRKAFDLFEQECIQFKASRDPKSSVVKRWKLL